MDYGLREIKNRFIISITSIMSHEIKGRWEKIYNILITPRHITYVLSYIEFLGAFVYL